jgi:site-specific DNA-methyltransferase (adenine-specific)
MIPTPAPYYTDEAVSLYQGDALELLPRLGSATVACVLTDPPYIIGAVSAGTLGGKAGGWADMMNSSLWFAAWYREVMRVLKPRGCFWTFCNWRSLPVVMRAACDVSQPITSMLVWDKQWIGPGGTQGLRPSYELVALMSRPDFAIPDRGVPDIWRQPASSFKENGHPAEKPEPLMRRLLQCLELRPGDWVLDPFMGSGTTGVAARSLGLRFLGIEAEPRWCEVAARRITGLLDLYPIGES